MARILADAFAANAGAEAPALRGIEAHAQSPESRAQSPESFPAQAQCPDPLVQVGTLDAEDAGGTRHIPVRPLERFDELSRSTPWLVNLKPAGTHLMEDFFHAGGLPAVMAELGDLLHLGAITVTGRTVGENVAGATIENTAVIRPATDPLEERGSLVVLSGNLCPDGAVM